uniref:Uncharacterized protein n=1 Tax=Arundo donax TaxID=35708 RepID=A0A0A9ABE0_ARUDO
MGCRKWLVLLPVCHSQPGFPDAKVVSAWLYRYVEFGRFCRARLTGCKHMPS